MNKEQLQHWALMAEVISAVAVVVTLIILIVEIRENSEIIRGTAYQSFRSQVNAVIVNRLDNPNLAEVWDKGLADPTSLNRLESRQFSDMIFMIVGNWESQFYLEQAGVFDESMGANAWAVTNTEGFRQWWRDRGSGYNPDFREAMEARMQQGLSD